MDPWSIIVAGFADGHLSPESVRATLLDGWNGSLPLEARTIHAADLENAELEKCSVVVFVVDARREVSELLPLIAIAQEAGAATLVLLDGTLAGRDSYEFAGSHVENVAGDATAVAARLESILRCQQEIRQLRAEVALARRFHGGLEGEITRMHEELQLAAMVQREFLPRSLPSLLGVDFAVLWRPAHYVSGDIYDVARLDQDHIGFFIADAVGHGVPAALMTMVICRSLTTKVIEGSSYRIVEPTEVLGRLNQDMIRRQGRTTRFATAVYAVVDCRRRVMRLAGAGHPPPLHVNADGRCRPLETSGGLLGVFDDEEYGQIEVELAVNDKVVLFSDGFEQAFPALDADPYKRRLPTDRYLQEFERLGVEQTRPEELIEALSLCLDDQRGSLHQIDDLTLICMRAGPLAANEGDETPRRRQRGEGAELPSAA